MAIALWKALQTLWHRVRASETEAHWRPRWAVVLGIVILLEVVVTSASTLSTRHTSKATAVA